MIDGLKNWLGVLLWVSLSVATACSGIERAADLPGSAERNHQSKKSVSEVSFSHEPNVLHVFVGEQHFGDYVYFDRLTPRPYFAGVKAPAGIQVTRYRPPLAGQDLMDHANMHPGVWLSFGDLSGNDYWRLKCVVEHERFIEKPRSDMGRGTFAVSNYYLDQSSENRIAQEEARYTVEVHPEGYLLAVESIFQPYGSTSRIVFGDQEEMGFSIRMHTALVEQFGGEIVDSEGRTGADSIWSQSADWIDYSGELQGKWVGVTLIPHPGNFRESWYHVRDYGLLTANPFGREAMGKGPRSEVIVKKGESLRLRFGVLLHSFDSKQSYNPEQGYRRYLEFFEGGTPKDR